MKKNKRMVPFFTFCVLVGSCAFALPTLAAKDLQSAQGQVMEKETPAEYMQDFDVADGYQNVFFLTEEEIKLSKELAINTFKKELGLDIPESLPFEYNVSQYGEEEENMLYISLNWQGETAKNKRLLSFQTAYIIKKDVPLKQQQIQLDWLATYNGYDAASLDSFILKSAQALKEDLDITLSEDIATDISVYRYLGPETPYQKQETRLTILRENTEKQQVYRAEFDDVNLEDSTGVLNRLQIDDGYMSNVDWAETVPEELKNKMLEKAIAFLNDKGVVPGNLENVLYNMDPQKSDILFSFAGPENTFKSFSVIISADLKIMGYEL